jgi:hypothetical protein
MIVTKCKPFPEVLKRLESAKRVYVMGCAGCATLCQTGGEKETAAFASALEEAGIAVSGRNVVDVPCDERVLKLEFQKDKNFSESDALLIMACGAGVQAVRDLTDLPVLPVLDTVYLGTIERIGVFREYCTICGNCIIDELDSLCPVTRCAKGLLNGPCGGVVEGKCEVDPEMECVWEKIFTSLNAKGQLDRLKEYQSPRDHGKKYEVLRDHRKK